VSLLFIYCVSIVSAAAAAAAINFDASLKEDCVMRFVSFTEILLPYFCSLTLSALSNLEQ
jgi:hypothetical protein